MNASTNVTHPMVSIGMPVHNGARFIHRTLDSILAQTYPHFELIISDNSSTDNTGTICDKYAARDSRIRFVKQCTNIGASRNFRYVLKAAKYERFIWAAADDWWDENRLEILVEALTPKDSAVSGKVRRYANEKLIEEFVPKSFSWSDWWHYLMHEESHCDKVYYIYGLIWRNSAIQALPAVRDEYGSDAHFCYLLLWNGNLKGLSQATLHVALHRDSSSAGESRKYRFSLKRLFIMAHPKTYYLRYYQCTPNKKKLVLQLALPLKYVSSQMHLWWRALKHVFVRKPNIYN